MRVAVQWAPRLDAQLPQQAPPPTRTDRDMAAEVAIELREDDLDAADAFMDF